MLVRPDGSAEQIRLCVVLTKSLDEMSAESASSASCQRLQNLEPAEVINLLQLTAQELAGSLVLLFSVIAESQRPIVAATTLLEVGLTRIVIPSDAAFCSLLWRSEAPLNYLRLHVDQQGVGEHPVMLEVPLEEGFDHSLAD